MGVAALVIGPDSTVAVLGASGFIGSHLVDTLLATGCRIKAFSRSGAGLLSHAALEDPNLLLGRLDLGDPKADFEACLEGVSICFHLISSTVPSSSNLDPCADVSSNLLGTLRLLEAARRQGVQRLIFTSSGGTVYGRPRQVPIPEDHPTDPTCSYGISKLAIEKYLALYRQLHGIESVVLRVANPYGERQRPVASQGAVAVFLARAMQSQPIEIWGDGTVVRDYVHVADVIAAMLAAVPYAGAESVFNIGSGAGLSLNQLVQAIAAELGLDPVVRYRPGRSFDVPSNILEIARARRELGWQPSVSFAEGLSRMRSCHLLAPT